MRQHIPAIVAGLLAGAIPASYAVLHKPAPTIVQPQTTIVARSPQQAGPMSADTFETTQLTRAEKRQAAAQWGDLDQKEVDALSEALKSLPRAPLTIFCQEDMKCGDMQVDFDNAFETAHWETKLEAPLIDDTVGVATSREDLRDAINAATSGRLNVKIIAKNGPFEVLVIGKKSGLCHTGRSPGPCGNVEKKQ